MNPDYSTGIEGRIARGRCSRSTRGACAGLDPIELSHVISPWFAVTVDAFHDSLQDVSSCCLRANGDVVLTGSLARGSEAGI